MATRKSLLDSIPDYEAIYNKAYDEVMKEKVDLRKYFSKDHLETMPELEKIVFVNRLQNYLILTKLGLNMGTPDFLPRTQQQKKMAFMNRRDSDENWTPARGRRKTNTGKGRQSARWQAGNAGVSQGKEVIASALSDGSLPPELRPAGKQQPFMGFRRVLARRLLHYLQNELTWKKFLRQALANRLIDADECEVLDPSDGLTLEKAMKKKQADYRNELRNRYPRRNIPEKNYKELEVPNEDEYILCEECNEEYLRGNCPVHGAVEFVKDKTVHDEYPRKKRRQQETGVVEVPQNQASKSIPSGLVIAPSTMPGAGLGVWTKRAFSRGTMFGPYGGIKVYSEMDAHASGYTWEIYKDGQLDHYIDAQDVSKSSWMRYVNCATSKSVQNVKAFQFSGGIYYRACVDIPVNVEMVVWYGEEYAEELGLVAKQMKPLGCCEAVGGITMSLPPVKAISRTSEHGLKTMPFVADQNQIEDKQTGYRNEVVPCVLDGRDKQHQILDVEKLRRQYRDGKERPHKCSLCIKAFTEKRSLITHMRKHTGEKLYTCTVCGLKCISQGHLNDHMRIHTGEKPYACTVCEAKFRQQAHIKAHMRIHTGERPYACTVCGLKCVQQKDLNDHMRVHTGERPYACTVCEAKFSQLGNLNKHMLIHTGERPYTCTVCGVKFRYSYQLKRHRGQHS